MGGGGRKRLVCEHVYRFEEVVKNVDNGVLRAHEQ